MSEASFKFDHVHIFARDVEAMAAWFAEFLDAEIVRSAVRLEGKIGPLRLFFQPIESGPHAGCEVPGYNHIAFTVSNIDAVAERLAAKDAVFAKAISTPRPGVRMFFLRGPEGLQVEILERFA